MNRKTRLPALFAMVIIAGAVLASLPSGTAQACYDYKAYDLEGTFDGTDVHLTWSPAEGYGNLTLSGYNIYREDESGRTKLLNLVPLKVCAFTDTTAQMNQTYWYFVKAYFAEEGESGPSNEVEVSLELGMPAPTGLEAFGVENAIRLEWYAPDTSTTEWGLVGYLVYRASAETGWSPALMTDDPVTGVGWNDTSAKLGAVYDYLVTAYYANGEESRPSNEVEITLGGSGGDETPPPNEDDGDGSGGDQTPEGAPLGLKAVMVETAVRLEWQPPTTGPGQVIGYYVYRSDSEYGFDGQPLIDFAIPGRTWTDITVQADITYTYWVTAVDGEGHESAKSLTVTIGTKAEKTILLTIDASTAVVNGQVVTLDQPPVIVNGRTLLPFRFVAENMGADVQWDQDKQQVTATYGETVVVLFIGSQTAMVNGEPTLVNVPPVVLEGRTMVPLRFLATAFGWQLDWNNLTRTVTVKVAPQAG